MIKANTQLADYRFVMLHGIRVRSGTNYFSKLVSCHPDIQLVPPQKTTDEFPFVFTIESWQLAFSRFVQVFNGNKQQFKFDDFAPDLGQAWLSYMIRLFELKPGMVFFKDPRVYHLDNFFLLFPQAKCIILIRDGRDNVASCMKAGLAKREIYSAGQRWKRQINHWLWRDFINHSRDWARSARQIEAFQNNFCHSTYRENIAFFRYEEMFKQPVEQSQRLFDFMELEINDAILKKITNLDVVGSSFYNKNQKEDAQKPNWQPTKKTDAFQPVGRWQHWNAYQKWLFKRLAGQELINFGYETDFSW